MAAPEVPASVDLQAASSEELFLTCLRDGDEAAWAELIRRFTPLIGSVVLRVAQQAGEASPEVVDDLIQETYLKLCSDKRRVQEHFKPARKDAVFGYIKVFSLNLARDYFKSRHAAKRGGQAKQVTADEELVPGSPLDRKAGSAQMDRDLLVEQVEKCLEGVVHGPYAQRDRRIFWLYYRVGLSASSIAGIPVIGLSTKGVESTIGRLTRMVREQLVDKQARQKGECHGQRGMSPAESL